MRNILDVFVQVAENEGITITKFEQKLGASKGVLSRAIKNRTDIQAKWLMKLVEIYPQYNPLWILTGNGNMVSTDLNQTDKKNTANNLNYKELAEARETIINLQKQDIVRLQSIVDKLS